MRLDDLARRAVERARAAAAETASAMDPAGYRRRRAGRSRLAVATATVAVLLVAVSVIVWVGPSEEDLAATPTTTIVPDTTTVAVPSVPPPIDPEQPSVRGAGWEELDAVPSSILSRGRLLIVESFPIAAHVGSWLFVWDPFLGPEKVGFGYLYALESGRWREAAPAPDGVCRPFGGASIVAVGDAVVVSGRGPVVEGCAPAAAYRPATDTWEPLHGELFVRTSRGTPMVWTGDMLVAPTLGLAYDWASGDTMTIPTLPGDTDATVHSPQQAHWTGDRIVAIGSGPLRAWSPGDDEWETLSEPPVPERARDSVWTDHGLLVANYDMAAAFYRDGAWSRPGDLPLRFFECLVETVSVGGTPVVRTCSGFAIWDEVRHSWVAVPLDDLVSGSWSTLVATDDALYVIDTHVRRFRIERHGDGSIVLPATIPVGVMQLDIPDGFDLVSSFAPEQDPAGFIGEDSTIGFVFTADGGRRCVVSSEYRGGDLITEEILETVVVVRPDGTAVEAFRLGAVDNATRFAVEASTSDLLIVGCEASSAIDGATAFSDAIDFLSGLWSPWE